jgi:tight adherence protein C
MNNFSADDMLLLVLVFVSVVCLALGATTAILHQLEMRRRLLGNAGSVRSGGAGVGGAKPSLRPSQVPTLIRSLVLPVEGHLVPNDPVDRSTLRRHLLQAGLTSPHAQSIFYSARIGLAALLPLLFLVAIPVFSLGIAGNRVISVAVILVVTGYCLPSMVVGRRRARRQLLCREGLPDALDLLLICVEAGLGIDAAIARVGQELAHSRPQIAEHFRLLALQMQAGKARDDAFRDFSERIGLDEVATLTALLCQSVTLGTSIADALRAHAEDMRAHRMLRAEEMAQQLGVKLSLPLIGLMVPALLLIVGAPAVVRLTKSLVPLFKQAGSG